MLLNKEKRSCCCCCICCWLHCQQHDNNNNNSNNNNNINITTTTLQLEANAACHATDAASWTVNRIEIGRKLTGNRRILGCQTCCMLLLTLPHGLAGKTHVNVISAMKKYQHTRTHTHTHTHPNKTTTHATWAIIENFVHITAEIYADIYIHTSINK